jgi:hypothetical protein
MKLLILSLFLFSNLALAKGSFMAQPTYDETTGRTFPVFGLSIYENLFTKKIAFNSWSGIGNLPEYELMDKTTTNDAWWMTTRNQIDIHHRRVTFSPGVQVLKTTEDQAWNTRYYLRMTFQLW